MVPGRDHEQILAESVRERMGGSWREPAIPPEASALVIVLAGNRAPDLGEQSRIAT